MPKHKKARKTKAKPPKRRVPKKSGSKAPPSKGRSIFDDKLVGELVERGRMRGFVTDTEILNYFPNIEKDISLKGGISATIYTEEKINQEDV